MSDLESLFNWRVRCNLLRGQCTWAKLMRAPSGRLTYLYKMEGKDGVAFRFSLLCEVGEPYQQPFIERLQGIVAAGGVFETRGVSSRSPSPGSTAILSDSEAVRLFAAFMSEDYEGIADYLVLPGQSQVDAVDATWQFKMRGDGNGE